MKPLEGQRQHIPPALLDRAEAIEDVLVQSAREAAEGVAVVGQFWGRVEAGRRQWQYVAEALGDEAIRIRTSYPVD